MFFPTNFYFFGPLWFAGVFVERVMVTGKQKKNYMFIEILEQFRRFKSQYSYRKYLRLKIIFTTRVYVFVRDVFKK